jgi:hypothetical protein
MEKNFSEDDDDDGDDDDVPGMHKLSTNQGGT